MHDHKISYRQLRTILLLALLPLATELLPNRLQGAGSAAWLCPLLAGAVAMLLALLLLKRKFLGNGDLGQQMAQRWGKLPARILAALFFLWGLFLLTAHASRLGGRLADSLRASPILLTGAVLLLAGWMTARGLPAFARACEVFALAVGFGFAMILLFGIFRLRWGYVLLFTIGELGQVPSGALTTLGTLALGTYALFIIGDVREEEGSGWRGRLALGALFLLVAAAVLLVLGRFGPALTGEIDRPFFQMVSGLGFQGAFQRLEELASALWVLGDEALLGLLLLSLRRLLAQASGCKEGQAMGWSLTALVFLGALPTAFWNSVMHSPILPWGNLAFGAGILLILAFSRKNEKTSKKPLTNEG